VLSQTSGSANDITALLDAKSDFLTNSKGLVCVCSFRWNILLSTVSKLPPQATTDLVAQTVRSYSQIQLQLGYYYSRRAWGILIKRFDHKKPTTEHARTAHITVLLASSFESVMRADAITARIVTVRLPSSPKLNVTFDHYWI
jgi:hypothetical protein